MCLAHSELGAGCATMPRGRARLGRGLLQLHSTVGPGLPGVHPGLFPIAQLGQSAPSLPHPLFPTLPRSCLQAGCNLLCSPWTAPISAACPRKGRRQAPAVVCASVYWFAVTLEAAAAPLGQTSQCRLLRLWRPLSPPPPEPLAWLGPGQGHGACGHGAGQCPAWGR